MKINEAIRDGVALMRQYPNAPDANLVARTWQHLCLENEVTADELSDAVFWILGHEKWHPIPMRIVEVVEMRRAERRVSLLSKFVVVDDPTGRMAKIAADPRWVDRAGNLLPEASVTKPIDPNALDKRIKALDAKFSMDGHADSIGDDSDGGV